MTAQGAAALRVILLVDSFTLPRWAAGSVVDMLKSSTLTVAGVVVNGAAEPWAPPPQRRSFPARLRNAWRHRGVVLLGRYLRFDQTRYPAKGADPFDAIDLTEILATIPRITALPRQTKFSDFIDDAALREIKALNPDVAVRFGFRILRGPVLGIPKHGVWSFHHDDNHVIRGGPPGVWEVLLGLPSTGAVLQRLSEDLDAGATIARTWTATNMISVHQTRVELYRAAAPLLVQKLHELQRRGVAALQPIEPAFRPYAQRLYVAPSLRELISGLASVARRLVMRKVGQLRNREQWRLMIGFDPRQPHDNRTPQSSVFRFKPLIPPDDRFWADPFPVMHDGRHLIFFEELVFGQRYGRICLIEITADGRASAPIVVLERPYHLSYPYVFEYAGSWYMMPEMAARGVQEVFRATSFPNEWELHTTHNFDRIVVDPTLHFDGQRWWLFVGTAPSPESRCDALSLYHSDSPLGPWQPHVANPVVSDARAARPAGRLFRAGEDLIRPAQDGTPGYGTAIVFKRVVRLDVDAYVEETIGRIDPHWAPDVVGTHTINAAGQLTVIDVRVVRRQ